MKRTLLSKSQSADIIDNTALHGGSSRDTLPPKSDLPAKIVLVVCGCLRRLKCMCPRKNRLGGAPEKEVGYTYACA
jgi:hypothetical protein